MSILATGEYKLLRRSHSLPHIASRHDSGVSGITATTNTTTGSCNLLDHIDYDSALGNEHHFNNQTRRYNKVKYHNYHHHNHHQQYENVRHKIRLFNCLVILATFCAPLPSPYHLHNHEKDIYFQCVAFLLWCHSFSSKSFVRCSFQSSIKLVCSFTLVDRLSCFFPSPVFLCMWCTKFIICAHSVLVWLFSHVTPNRYIRIHFFYFHFW